jgi:ligand-binding sensor domain-containing protein/signal transduction histidine kinase
LLLFVSAVAHAERLPVKTYTVADGLLRDSVSKIRQDSRGFLWFCTAEGISRFDGYAFTNFTVNDGLPERHVNDFLETRSGEIWIATDGGLAKLNPKGLISSKEDPLFNVTLPSDPNARSIRVLFEDETGTIWAGTSAGLYKMNERSQLEAVDLGKPQVGTPEIQISAIVKDRRGAIWLGTMDSGLFRIQPDGVIEQFNRSDGLPDVNISVIHEDKNGRIWVGLRPRSVAGLVLLVPEPRKDQTLVERFYTMKDGLPTNWITDLFESSDGKLWIGTTRSLCEWQTDGRSVCKIYKKDNDLCDEEFWSIIEDRDKNLWMGTRCGLKKWTRSGFTSYTTADGMGDSLVNSIFENSAGELFASFNDGNIRTVARFDGEKFELVKPNFPPAFKYFGWGWKQTVWQDRVGDWWFPANGGISRFRRPTRFEDLASSASRYIKVGSEEMEVFRLFEDSRGDIWFSLVGSDAQLWRWSRADDSWRNLTQEVKFGKYRVGSAFVEDGSGNLWIGTGSDREDTALIRYRDGQFKIFSQSEYPLLARWIRDLYVDSEARLWIADTANGVLRLDDVNADKLNLTQYTPAEGLSSIGVSCITGDEFGRIYFGTGRGLDRLDPSTGQIENFTTADGLPNSNIEIAYRDRKNDLWFGTTNGLARFVPERQKIRQTPNTLITGLRVNGESQSVSVLGEKALAPVELNSDQRQISVDFLGLGASLGERLKYEYRLESGDWTPTQERTINFASFAPGDHQFEVRALTADRLFSSPATVSFRIAAPVWQRWWFIVLICSLVAAAIYLIYRNRLMRLLEMERMRTRIATDLHDDIGANLTRISILSEVARQRSGPVNGNSLTSIADIARESVASMNDIVWAIAPEHDSLLDLTRRMRQHSEEIFAQREIELHFDAPSEDTDLKLSVGIRRDVLLIFKEAVNNAARHSGCTKVQIDFFCEHSFLKLRVKDNGSGFVPGNGETVGQGFRSMTRRSEALGGQLTINSMIGLGTDIQFVLPSPK